MTTILPPEILFTGRYGVESKLLLCGINVYKLEPGNINFVRYLSDVDGNLTGIDLEGGPVFYIGLRVIENVEIKTISLQDNAIYFTVIFKDKLELI